MKKLQYSILNPIIFLIILWQVRLWENMKDMSLVKWGIYPRDLRSFKGVFTWVFVHGSDQHLLSNTFPILILGSALYYFYHKLANKVILIVYAFSGIMVWIIAKPAFHIGASGLIYGVFGFLLVGGIFRRDRISIALSLLVTVFYGGIIWGIFPLERGVSWEGHAMGFLAGIIASLIYRKDYVEKEKSMQEVEDYRNINWNFNLQLKGALRQTAHSVVMIRPRHFGFNPETAKSNAFQKTHTLLYDRNLNKMAVEEFDGIVAKLRSAGVNVMVFDDNVHVELPDAVFPNNWISMHHGGEVVYYPMLTENRRKERREDIIDILVHAQNFVRSKTINLTAYETENKILEGTGSMVLDHRYRVAFANLSPRTNQEVFEEWCKELKYHPILFTANDANGNPIYHANVLMSMGEAFVVMCFDVITDERQRENLKMIFQRMGREVIAISEDQMNHFCGNILQVENMNGQKVIAMSSQAYEHFTQNQLNALTRHGTIVHAPIPTIENFGGGSVRCMMAEVFLPKLRK